MMFLNVLLLAGLGGVGIPILIHLFNRKAAKRIDWGAVQFLRDSLVTRRRRILIEEILLLAVRCLLIACLAMAMARPFASSTSRVPWLVVLPLLMLSIVGMGISFALWQYPRWRWGLLGGAAVCLLLAGGLILLERHLHVSRFAIRGRRDVVLVLDGSASMSIPVDGEPNFERARREAMEIVRQAPPGTSFSVILAGDRPAVKTPVPLSDREEVLWTLTSIQPQTGSMRPLDALSVASVELNKGFNTTKQIVFFTDRQKHGWSTDVPSRWRLLREMFDSLPTYPRIAMRRYALPEALRNLCVASVAFSRQLVGTDRQVEVRVPVENTGDTPLTPAAVNLKIGEQLLENKAVATLRPKTSETVSFFHRFKRPGVHTLEASVLVEDDWAADNQLQRVRHVCEPISALVLDTGGGGGFLERTGAFAALGLAPGKDAVHIQTPGRAPQRVTPKPNASFVFRPTLLDVSTTAEPPPINRFGVVVLADVPRLSRQLSEDLVRYVESGGGLLIAVGRHADTTFFNTWPDRNGNPLLPGILGDRTELPYEAVGLSAETAGHASVAALKEAGRRAIDAIRVQAYWEVAERVDDPACSVCMRMANGSPFLLERKVERGHVLLVACSLDVLDGNIVMTDGFVPFLQGLTAYLANPLQPALNVAPGEELAVGLYGGAPGVAGLAFSGLRGEYFADARFTRRVGTRIDGELNFNWNESAPMQGVPQDCFSVRWTGSIVPPRTDVYYLESESDDRQRVWVDGRQVLSSAHGDNSRRGIRLRAGRHHRLRVEFVEDYAVAYARLFWSYRGQGREIVPRRYLRAGPGSIGKSDGAVLSVEAPDGTERQAWLAVEGAGQVVRVAGDVIPGLYRLRFPDELREGIASLTGGGQTLPFSVLPDRAESRLAGLAQEELDLVSRIVGVLRADSVVDVLRILEGKAVGQEFWRYFAIAALVFLVGETLLTRWIARQRRQGEEEIVDFEGYVVPSAQFRSVLDKLRGMGEAAGGKGETA